MLGQYEIIIRRKKNHGFLKPLVNVAIYLYMETMFVICSDRFVHIMYLSYLSSLFCILGEPYKR